MTDLSWYYQRHRKVRGPLPEAELAALHQSGRLPADTPVRCAPSNSWIPLWQVPGLTAAGREAARRTEDAAQPIAIVAQIGSARPRWLFARATWRRSAWPAASVAALLLVGGAWVAYRGYRTRDDEPSGTATNAAADAVAPAPVATQPRTEAGRGLSEGATSEQASATGLLPTEELLTEQEAFARVKASVAVIASDAGIGSGFIVGPELVATNYHVIQRSRPEDLVAYFPDAEQPGPYRAELVAENPTRDLAVLHVACAMPALPLARAPPQPGEKAFAVGSPGFAQETTYLPNAISVGHVSSLAQFQGQEFLHFNLAINPGNSGGPVLNLHGEVLAVACLRDPERDLLALCIPIADLRPALAAPNPPPPDVASWHLARYAFAWLRDVGDASVRFVFEQLGAADLARENDLEVATAVRIAAEQSRPAWESLVESLPDDLAIDLAALREDEQLPSALRQELEWYAEAVSDLQQRAACPDENYPTWSRQITPQLSPYQQLRDRLQSRLVENGM